MRDSRSKHEVNEAVKGEVPGYAIYNVAQVDSMRKDLAGYGVSLSYYKSDNLRLLATQKRLERKLEQAMLLARRAKEYDISDYIRDRLLSEMKSSDAWYSKKALS